MTDGVLRERVLLYQYPQLLQGTLQRRYKRFLADVSFFGSTTSISTCSAAATSAPTAVAAAVVSRNKTIGTCAEPAKRRRRIAHGGSAEVVITAAAAAAAASALTVPAAAELSTATATALVTTVVHCPNTGSMMGLLDALPALAVCSVSTVATRKYQHTLEMISIPSTPGACSTSNSGNSSAASAAAPQRTWVGVHSALANKLVKEVLTKRLLPQLGEYESLQPEVKHGSSRFDFLLTRLDQQKVYVEVKSITLAMPCSEYKSLRCAPGAASNSKNKRRRQADRNSQQQAVSDATGPAAAAEGIQQMACKQPADGMIALFPDAVSDRAQRHVQELTQLRVEGHGAVCIFAIQRSDCCCFAPAAHIDPAYAAAVKAAAAAGVQMIAVVCEPDPESKCIWFRGCVPVHC